MREYLLQFMGEEAAMGVQFMVALLAVLLLFGLFVWFLRLITGKGRRTPTSQNHRLAVLDRTQIDDTRSLVLVRRDDMEHLVMIGGPTDVVVESNIDPYADEADRNSGQPLPGHEIARRVIAQRPLRTMSLSGSAAAVAESIGLAAASRPEVSLAPPPPPPESTSDSDELNVPPVEIQLELVPDVPTAQDDHPVVTPPKPPRPVMTAAPEPQSVAPQPVAPQTYSAPPTYTAPPVAAEPPIAPVPVAQEQFAPIVAPEVAPVAEATPVPEAPMTPEMPRTPDPAPQAQAEPVFTGTPAPVAEPIAPQSTPEPVAIAPQPVPASVPPVVPAAPTPAPVAPQPEPLPIPPVEATPEPVRTPDPAPLQPTPVAPPVSVAQPLAEQDFYQAPPQPKPQPQTQPQPVAYTPPRAPEPISPAPTEPETRDLSAEMENALMQELEQPQTSNLSRVNHVVRQDPPAMASPVMREAPIPPAPPVVRAAPMQQQELVRQQDVDLSAGLAEAMGLEPEAPDEPQYSSEQGAQDDMELEDAIAGMLIGDHPQNDTTGVVESSVYSASESVPEGPEPPLDTTRPGRVDDEMSRLLQELAIPSRA